MHWNVWDRFGPVRTFRDFSIYRFPRTGSAGTGQVRFPNRSHYAQNRSMLQCISIQRVAGATYPPYGGGRCSPIVATLYRISELRGVQL